MPSSFEWTTICRAIFFDNVLRCLVEGLSRRGPGVDLIPFITRIPTLFLNRVTITAIPPEHFNTWVRQVPTTVRTACSAPSRPIPEVQPIDAHPSNTIVQAPFTHSDQPQTEVTANRKYKQRRSMHTDWTGELKPATVFRKVNGKCMRLCVYPTKAISPPSSDRDDTPRPAPPLQAQRNRPPAAPSNAPHAPPETETKRSRTRTASHVQPLNFLRSAIDFLETRLEVVERRSRRSKRKLSLLTEQPTRRA